MYEAFRKAGQTGEHSAIQASMQLGGGSSCDEFASTALLLDASLGELGEFLGSDECDSLGQLSLAKHLEVTLQKA